MDLSVEHVLLFALVVCGLYYLMGRCDCKEGIVIDPTSGVPFGEAYASALCPEEGATGACYGYNQNCIFDHSCSYEKNTGKGCIVEPNSDMSKETRYPCRICRTDPNDLREYKQCPENPNDNNSDVPSLPIIPDKIGGCTSTRYGCCANGTDYATSSDDPCKQKKNTIKKRHKKNRKKHMKTR